MIAIKKARKFIQAEPLDADAQIISALVLQLQSGGNISVPQLYQLKHANFLLALEILAEWRLDRYYAKKLRLLDISDQAYTLAMQGQVIDTQATLPTQDKA
ncbi:hypothetical protein [Rhodoferax sp.]|uniref:hypothetical protein n=1 Tax=Rhodoferax sp. TaxID=50421 RepID=UPI00262E3849|nr:hypothetical protein [Rhodoferax sp.]MDD2808328.1 hypothetical protein [Rhodoferax sp.]